jgi:phage/plasmid-associated DNA primase
MLEPKNKTTMANDAFKMADGSKMVRYRSTTYIPADYETKDVSIVPDIDRTIWLPMSRHDIRLLAAHQFNTLFTSDAELSSFDFMVAQNAEQMEEAATTLLVRTVHGLRVLDEQGQLVEPDGEFRPNAVLPMLNEDKGDKEWVFNIISTWLDSDEEAESLLSHLATSLAPGWSASKYVLLLGEGRNGKSVMLKMLHSLFGRENVSSVTRQAISTQSPAVLDLNGKLLNIVYDGMAEYLKDSGAEKSLIVGETVGIRRLYESTNTAVQTNALFLEGLQQEPKTKDKSSALQKRLARFYFPNVYALDHTFERSVLRSEMLGAFLSVLIDRYVLEDTIAERLAPTRQQIQLQIDQMYANQMGLQFLKYVEETGIGGTAVLMGQPFADLVQRFHSWRLKSNDLGTYSEPDVMAMFKPLLNMERKSVRTPNGPRKVQTVVSLKIETKQFIESLEGDADAAVIEALVDDGGL